MSRRVWIGVAVVVVVLAVVRPWTVRPLHVDAPPAFDPATYAGSLWPRVLDDANARAVDVTATVAPASGSGAKARFMKGSGVVTAIDRTSRVGLLRVRLPGASGPTIVIQIGPVLRGTTLRDAVSFIQFSDFTNQFDYAAAANALNDHVLRAVIEPAGVDGLQGRTIRFVGATSNAVAPDAPIEIVPVMIAVAEAGR